MNRHCLKEDNFWQKYRPVTIDETILPLRIKNLIINGIGKMNFIFSGSSGLGKTTICSIITQNIPTLKFDAKIGVDELRKDATRFCQQMMTDLETVGPTTQKRIIWFEEFDIASSAVQDELKSFIEKYSDRCSFIATTNYVHKIDKLVLSRFKIIEFRPLVSEDKEIKTLFFKRVETILKTEEVEYDRTQIADLINKYYPDFRQCWVQIQSYILSGEQEKRITVEHERLFTTILSDLPPDKIWDFLNEYYYSSISETFGLLSSDFFIWVRNNYPQKLIKLVDCMNLVSEFSDVRLPNAVNPFNTLFCLITQLQLKLQN